MDISIRGIDFSTDPFPGNRCSDSLSLPISAPQIGRNMDGMDGMDGMQVEWKQPSHPELIYVSRRSDRRSSAISLVSLPAGAHFAGMTSAVPCEGITWTSVQCHRDGSSIELNSDLVFCNHSCRPSLVFDMTKLEVRVVEDRPLKTGDELTFFYPSTEWDMTSPFHCTCSEDGCGIRIAGAKHAKTESLKKNWLNQHIKDLLAAEGLCVSQDRRTTNSGKIKVPGDSKVGKEVVGAGALIH